MTTTSTKTRPRKLGEDKLLTTNEVAELLRLTTPSVRELIEAGRLPATRFGRHYRVWKSDVEVLIALGLVGS